MGGRGATSSVKSISTLQKQETSIRQEMEKIYKENSGFTRIDLKEVEQARDKWYKLKEKADKLKEDISKKQIKEAEEKRKKEKTTKKTFVNSYGEATKRTITNTTYERRMKKQNKAILRNMGY